MLLALCLLACTKPPPPDVLVVVMDTVRADFVGGAEFPATPHLDAMVANGVRYTDVTSPSSWTWPAHGTLFTGQPPWVHGAHHRTILGDAVPGSRRAAATALRTDLPTLAERFDAAGYRTVAVSANGWLHPSLGLTRGFQQVSIEQGCGHVVEQALPELQSDGPLLLFLNFMEAHAPYYRSPAPWLRDWSGLPPRLAPYAIDGGEGLDMYREGPDGRSGFQSVLGGALVLGDEDRAAMRALYAGEVMTDDHCLGKALAAWQQSRPGGIIAVTADHGEYLGERRLVEHGFGVWPEVTHVPLVISAPGLPGGVSRDTPTALQALPSSLLALAGLEPLGPDRLPGLPGAEPDESTGIIQARTWHHPTPAAMYGGRFAQDWSLVRQGDEALVFSSGGQAQIFDLGSDPGMTRDLAPERPERVRALRAAGDFGEAESTGGIRVPDEVAEGLRGLGYVE